MVRLVYWQHYVKHEDEFDGFEDALSFATYLEAFGRGAPEAIINTDRTVAGDELSRLIYEAERDGHY